MCPASLGRDSPQYRHLGRSNQFVALHAGQTYSGLSACTGARDSGVGALLVDLKRAAMISAAMAFLSAVFSSFTLSASTLRLFLDRFSLFDGTCCHSAM